MHGITSQVLLDVREVGENVLSTGKDIQLLLREAKVEKVRHARDLVANILSLCAYLSGLSIKDFDRGEELSDEIRKIEFTSVSLRFALKEEDLQPKVKEVFDLLRILEISSNRIITLSFVSKLSKSKKYNDEDVCYLNKRSCERSCDGVCYEDSLSSGKSSEATDKGEHGLKYSTSEKLGSEDVCYKDKFTCEKDCNGECYENNLDSLDDSFSSPQDACTKEPSASENINDEEVCFKDNTCDVPLDDQSCPEYTEHFTESPYTHVESGVYEDIEHVQDSENSSTKMKRNMSEITEEDLDLSAAIRDSLVKFDSFLEDHDLTNNDRDNILDSKGTQTLDLKENLVDTETDHPQQGSSCFSTTDDSVDQSGDTNLPHDTETEEELAPTTLTNGNVETDTTDEYTTYATLPPEPTTNSYDSEETTTSGYEATTESSYYSYTTEDSTTAVYESYTTEEPTTVSYDSYTTEEPTTPAYETTTQDLYKLSQDVYSMANDLSSKANEISSLSSDISSKVSSMGSMVSDLNTYDNDELTKTINSVNKMTQEMSSKTSEMSSGCSTMSSLASDIGSASSDLSTSERRHPIKTTPWQKINTKGQDLVTAAQGVVSAAQEVLSKVGGVVELAKGLRVADAVEAAGYEVTSKAQLVISETLGVASAVLELMTALER